MKDNPTKHALGPVTAATRLPPVAYCLLPVAACCLLPVLWGCDIETKSESEFCSEMPPAICARLFDEGCAAVSGQGARYASEDECVSSEKAACEARAADSRLSFDEEKAAACMTEIEDQDCSRIARGDIHECDKVFTGGDAGVAPVTAPDAGTPGDGGGDLYYYSRESSRPATILGGTARICFCGCGAAL